MVAPSTPSKSPIRLPDTGNPALDAILHIVNGVLKPGSATSEGKLALVLTVASIVIAVGSQLFDKLGTTFPDSHWIHLAISLFALLGAVLTVLGYGSSRVSLKQAALDLLQQVHSNSTITALPPPSAGGSTAGDSTPALPEPREVVTLPDGVKVVAVGEASIASLKAHVVSLQKAAP